ncbi:hypothetical protein [Streptomyces sp. NPDC002599]|uniref:hypothetical protein n=1 Tax=Streptomyces sp. NPDC002599 TaxID=3154421 RepID=UPI00332C9342
MADAAACLLGVAVVMQPVLKMTTTDGFGFWPVAETESFGFLPLSGELSPIDGRACTIPAGDG